MFQQLDVWMDFREDRAVNDQVVPFGRLPNGKSTENGRWFEMLRSWYIYVPYLKSGGSLRG